ncbi:uncharacterized protein VP01_4363g2 [Puccinia sorghi]|uniref:Helicase ATP-binding domain-containing protein n=1 Tax=Puccinia sorghi TaxID=27349 RepID=A0A0L6UPS1_9BASI|nr:uncharacterized protein VP01_4363g2 [Puccinia sorghi]
MSSAAATAETRSHPLGHSKKTLVVCPICTLANWEAEIHKHVDLNVTAYSVYHGDERKKLTRKVIFDSNIVLVTYDTVSSSYEAPDDVLFQARWFCIILDEAHVIRDLLTKQSKAILGFQGNRKLCLTGTPLQNHLSNLFTLLQFIGVDPWAREEVSQACIKPNIRQKSPKAIDLLQQLLATVSLRSLKIDLPPKLEENKQYIDLANMYGVNRESDSWDSADFFQRLTMLRLYCNHPELTHESQYNLPQEGITWRDSPKVVRLVEDLKKHSSAEQDRQRAKAVVFSQWTMFLKMILYEQLDGSRSLDQREKSLAIMRHNPNTQVLLATIGAGGTGIDLTFAQHVYLMVSASDGEPCWNPSVESQATDQAYRLGQRCTVHITRYFIEDSVEVNIMEVQKRKKELVR